MTMSRAGCTAGVRFLLVWRVRRAAGLGRPGPGWAGCCRFWAADGGRRRRLLCSSAGALAERPSLRVDRQHHSTKTRASVSSRYQPSPEPVHHRAPRAQRAKSQSSLSLPVACAGGHSQGSTSFFARAARPRSTAPPQPSTAAGTWLALFSFAARARAPPAGQGVRGRERKRGARASGQGEGRMALLAALGSAPLAQVRPAFQETQVKGQC